MNVKRGPDADLLKGVAVGAIVGAIVLAVAAPLLQKPAPERRVAVAQPMLLRVADIAPVDRSPVALPAALPAAQPAPSRRPDFGDAVATREARRVAQWVVGTSDNGSAAFAILDKKDARVFVFAPDGKLVGATPVLLGSAVGDDTVPGIGDRPIAQVKPDERTTPAGRFVTEPGHNTRKEHVVWVDYDAAVSMHPVLLTNPAERRAERLATPTPADNRISYGCINVPVPFFNGVLWPTLRDKGSIVYVLPEVRTLEATFPGIERSPS